MFFLSATGLMNPCWNTEKSFICYLTALEMALNQAQLWMAAAAFLFPKICHQRMIH
jgi:hypothetical protein